MTHGPMQDELVRVLGHYALGQPKSAHRTALGFVNDNWIVVTDRGRFFLKHRHPDLRRPVEIRAQHDLMQRLCQSGFPAPNIISTLRGETLLIVDGECFEIHEYIRGEPYDHGRAAHLVAAASTLGHYHTVVEGLALRALHHPNDLYSPLLLSAVLTDLIAAWDLAQDPIAAPIIRRIKAHTRELEECFAQHGVLPHLIVHGDYYAGNLLFDGDRVIGVVDYDKARWQQRVVELSEALIYFSSPRPGHLKHLVYPGFLQWESFVQFSRHYVHSIVLDESEVCALPDYVRCIWLQMSLTRLLKRDPCPSKPLDALREVLMLADWARANGHLMSETVRSIALN